VWTTTVAFGTVVFQVFGSVVPELLDVVKPDTVSTHVLWPYAGPFISVPTSVSRTGTWSRSAMVS
jgi:hypothetical protein